MPPRRQPRAYAYDEELAEQFESMSLRKGARKPFPMDPENPCHVISNTRVRRKYGLVGDPSIDVDHIVEGHYARSRGLNPEVQVGLQEQLL